MAKEGKRQRARDGWKSERETAREPPAIKPPSRKQACCLIRVTPSCGRKEGGKDGRRGREGKCSRDKPRGAEEEVGEKETGSDLKED